MARKIIGVFVLSGPALVASGSATAAVEVLFSQVAGHPSAVVPPGASVPKGTEFKMQATSGFDRPFASPDGSKFFFTGLANVATTEDECYIVWDSGAATVVAREGTNIGSPSGDLLATGDQRMGINNSGHFIFSVDTNAATTQDEVAILWNGSGFVLAAREGDPFPPVPTENVGSAVQSVHLLADGSVVMIATGTVGAEPDATDDWAVAGNTIVVQMGDAIGAQVWDTFNTSEFYVTPDGAHWLLGGGDNSATTQDSIVVVDGVVVIREGTPLPGFVSNVVAGGPDEQTLLNDGSWMARGNNADGEDWVLRNGVTIATTDDPITPGSEELYDDAIFADCFFFIAGNSVGDYVIGGVTTAADVNANAVLVLNGEQVVARENDPIDLNGNGLPDDDAFISVFNNDDGILTDDLKLVFFADLRNGAGTFIGQAVLRIDLALQPCPADIDDDGQISVTDLLAVINNWGGGAGNPADVNGDDIVDVQDLLAVINAWGACP